MGYIELKNVTYTYPLAQEPSVQDISAVLEKGKFYADLYQTSTKERWKEKLFLTVKI